MSEKTNEEKLKTILESLPHMKREVEDTERLLTLARQAPFAGANYDFLERILMVVTSRKETIRLSEALIKAEREG